MAGSPNRPSSTLLALAVKQGGVVGRQQVSDLGVDRRALARMVQSGAFERRGAALWLPESVRSIEARWRAATFSSAGWLSHWSAVECLGAELPNRAKPPGVHVVTRFGGPRASHDDVVVHHSVRLGGTHVFTAPRPPLTPIPCTTAPRTLVDMAAPAVGLTDDELIFIFDGLWRAQKLHARWLAWFLKEEGSGLPGARRLRAILRTLQVVDSPAERQLVTLLNDAGLGPFVTQYEVRSAGRLIARLDVAWPEITLAAEQDGWTYHSGAASFEHDRQRDGELVRLHWQVIRITPYWLDRAPDEVVATIADAREERLYRRSSLTSGDPPTEPPSLGSG